MNLSTVYMGLNLRNPLIVGSSGLTGTTANVKKCYDAGAGAVVLKSIFEEQIESDMGNMAEESNWYPEAMDYISAYGSENAVSKHLTLLEESRKSFDIPVIPSVHCFGKGDWVEYGRKLENSGASGIELNAFILPSDPRRKGRENENVILDIVSDMKSQVSIPVAVKIGPYFSSLSGFVQELDGIGADAVVIFNRFFRIDFDIENLKVVSGSRFSATEETEEVLRWVSILNPLTKNDICATTGIHDGASVVKHLLAGAKAVQVCSSVYKNGLGVISDMLGFLADWMRNHNYNSTDDFIGKLSQNRRGNPAELERVQFMKTSVRS